MNFVQGFIKILFTDYNCNSISSSNLMSCRSNSYTLNPIISLVKILFFVCVFPNLLCFHRDCYSCKHFIEFNIEGVVEIIVAHVTFFLVKFITCSIHTEND